MPGGLFSRARQQAPMPSPTLGSLLSVTSMTILSLGPGAFRPRDEELPSSAPTAEVPVLALKLGELDLLMCVGVEQGVRLGLSNLVRTVKTNKPLRICLKVWMAS